LEDYKEKSDIIEPLRGLFKLPVEIMFYFYEDT
jgi:hypothetical protein